MRKHRANKKGLFEVNFNGQKVNKFADLANMYLQIIKCNINHGLYKSGVKKVLLISDTDRLWPISRNERFGSEQYYFQDRQFISMLGIPECR